MPIEERRRRGFSAHYYRIGNWAISHRWAALGLSMLFFVGGALVVRQVKTQFFPKDYQYLATVDIWLPEDATLSATHAATRQTEDIIREVAAHYGVEHPGKDGKPRQVLASLTTFVGGGAPRFWSSVAPEQEQTNYGTIIIKARDKHDTDHLLEPIQVAVDARVAGATVDVRQIEVGAAIGIPLAIRVSGEDERTLRQVAESVKNVFRETGDVVRIRDDWGAESFALKFGIDSDRANLVGVTNEDVAGASVAALNGSRVALLRDGHKQIPIVARLEMHERARAGDVENLYVYASNSTQQVPLSQIAKIDYGMQTERIQRRQQFRTITVSAFPRPGVLTSEALAAAMPELRRIEAELPLGFRMEIGGEYEEQRKGFASIAMVMLMSVLAIFVTLVIQFKHAFKPLIVFAAIPFGIIGALIYLRIMGTPFGFMAFLGVASLVGVIVSHVIVLFDFIEEAHERGAPLRDALLDAGIVRLRPVLITVGATVIALFPLASHGGPLWQPMCYAQIGGLVTATFITLLLVPVLYTIFVRDLKLIRWETES
jgi:multidrug efflux pump subunit AcrB